MFSKLSFSISLLFILILLGYLFYRSYSSLSIAENKESLQSNNLQNSINLNSSKIEKIEIMLSENSQKLNNIFDVIDSNNKNIDFDNLLKEIQNDFINIKSELKKLHIDLENNKITKEQSPKSNIKKINTTSIAKLIKMAFEQKRELLMSIFFGLILFCIPLIWMNDSNLINEKLNLIHIILGGLVALLIVLLFNRFKQV